MKDYAPVLIPTLDRYEHFKRCVTSLSRCTHADKTELFVAIDYPKKPQHEIGHKQIKDYIDRIEGFKNVLVVERKNNYGVPKNINNAREEYVFAKYNRIISSEDDNEFAPNFLDYMNKALTSFESDENISMVCGYNSPIKMPDYYKHNYYFSQRFNAWGNGMWRKKYPESLVWDHKELSEFFSNKMLRKKLKHQNEKLFYMVKSRIRDKERLLGDGVITLLNIKNSTYCIFPVISLVRNHGFDGSGTHIELTRESIYKDQVISSGRYFQFNDKIQSSPDKNIEKLFHKYYSYTWYKRIKVRIKLSFIGKSLVHMKRILKI